jgi:anti-sigma B factor antagonist
MDAESDPTQTDVLSISTSRQGTRAVVELAGELDLHGSGRLTAAVQQVLDDEPTAARVERLELDAGGLTFADSAGLRAVLIAQSETQSSGATFVVTAVSPPVQRMIEMAGLGDLLLPG